MASSGEEANLIIICGHLQWSATESKALGTQVDFSRKEWLNLNWTVVAMNACFNKNAKKMKKKKKKNCRPEILKSSKQVIDWLFLWLC